jgi:hypothetical protein
MLNFPLFLTLLNQIYFYTDVTCARRPPVGRNFPLPVTWICEAVMPCVEIVTFSFSSFVGGYAAFCLVSKVLVTVYLLLTRGLLWLLDAYLLVDLQALVA